MTPKPLTFGRKPIPLHRYNDNGLALRIMTPLRAKRVRQLRLQGHASWRQIAAVCHKIWKDGDSSLCDMQFAGVDICQAAASWFGEHYAEEPWNGTP